MGSIVCPLPPLVSTASPAAGSGPLAEALVLLPPRKHALARTSSPGPPATVALPAARCAGHRCGWTPGGTAWAPGKSLQGGSGPGDFVLGLSGAGSTRVEETGQGGRAR